MTFAYAPFVLLALAAPALGQNLLENGGFEELDGFAFPAFWNEYPGSALSTDTVRSGANAMRVIPVSSLQPGPTQAEHLNPNAEPAIAATPGVEYEFSGYALHRSDDSLTGSGHIVGLSLVFYAENTAVTGHSFKTVFDGTTDDSVPAEDVWHPVSISMVAPEGSAGVGVGLVIMTDDSNRLNGSGYFDDMELRALAGPADFDGDGAINASDLAILLAAWGTCAPGTCATDLDGDGATGSADLAALLAAWTG